MSNSVDPDQTPHIAACDQGLRCLLIPFCLHIYDNYGNEINCDNDRSNMIRVNG